MSGRETIAAIATPPGQGGIAIVRISGAAAAEVGRRVVRAGRAGLTEPRHVYVGRAVDPTSGEVLDEVLAFWMPGPRSYTGEDVVEIHGHGGSIVSRRVLEAVVAAGARPAGPGEFTRRAFENGRLDLAQAEAVADLIAARSEAGRRLACSQLDGDLSSRVEALREAVIAARALCEVAIDFADEDLPHIGADRIGSEVQRVRGELDDMLARFARARVRFEGGRVVLAGKPNVGKSSLLNALAGRERVIVTPVAGTTRDVVEVPLELAGVPVVVADTAGLRATEDEIERHGVARATAAVAEAACVVMVLDGSRVLDEADTRVCRAPGTVPAVVAVNKCDLPATARAEDVARLAAGRPVAVVSAATGAGLTALGELVASALLGGEREAPDGALMFRTRHRDAALRAIAALDAAAAGLRAEAPLELVASDLGAAADALAVVTGAIVSEDVLDRVFAEFCIGK